MSIIKIAIFNQFSRSTGIPFSTYISIRDLPADISNNLPNLLSGRCPGGGGSISTWQLFIFSCVLFSKGEVLLVQ